MSEALGMIECRSFPAMVEAADAMVKAAKVELVSYEKTGGGYTTAVVRGDASSARHLLEATGPTPTAFETRNLGSTLEIAPTVSGDGRFIASAARAERGRGEQNEKRREHLGAWVHIAS